jgi:hypothetical protein
MPYMGMEKPTYVEEDKHRICLRCEMVEMKLSTTEKGSEKV